MQGEIEYITKEQLIRNGLQGLTKERVYEIVAKIDKKTVSVDTFIQVSFFIRKSGKISIIMKIEGSPKYFSGLFSLYAIIRVAKRVTDREEDLLDLGVIDEPEYQEIIIEHLPAVQLSTGLELIRKIEDVKTKLAKKVKEELLVEAKHYNLIDSMDIFL